MTSTLSKLSHQELLNYVNKHIEHLNDPKVRQHMDDAYYWAVGRPEYSIYDGNTFDPSWATWIRTGRIIFQENNQEQYIKLVMDKVPRLERKDIVEVLEGKLPRID
jgi:hypothetical protein